MRFAAEGLRESVLRYDKERFKTAILGIIHNLTPALSDIGEGERVR